MRTVQIVKIGDKYAVRRRYNIFAWKYLDTISDNWWTTEESIKKYCLTNYNTAILLYSNTIVFKNIEVIAEE